MKVRVRDILTLRCRDATRLLSDEIDRPLTRTEWLAVHLHTPLCRPCRIFGRQIRFLAAAIQHCLSQRIGPNSSATGLSEAGRLRIERALRDATG